MSSWTFDTLPDAETLLRISCRQEKAPRDPSPVNTSSSKKPTESLGNPYESIILDAPDLDLKIPGEPILCKAKACGEYWPASIAAYVGLRTIIPRWQKKGDTTPLAQKYYWIKFCDGTHLEVGRIQTTEIQYHKFYPQLLEILPELDAILAGNGLNHDIKRRHEDFLKGPIKRCGLQDITYGNYSDELLFKAGRFLWNRYFNTVSSPVALEPSPAN
ncbi:hypothetical protein PGTUg99_000442 [Puccinia graminis f. sp. tritici]|uniref:Uncharacterized protein n=1 Tax=Puccinia graminis f. sp. tritici TaxID=56615 RepID=A0A5B0PSU3_PUCGR|nr:hypothetical protein PGTUg99_005448 [Puccinia graminis f. sp. tritici]KAA1103700.1 hypothetical protein PGTUg99_008089 [Puccinia graminis f. sp. tritici]KAA1127604.1 hypothetical protein PGTUg99_000442 [Puccinia graminis f. sp. tritici]